MKVERPVRGFVIIFCHKQSKPWDKDFYTWVWQTSQGPKISIISHKYVSEEACRNSLKRWSKKFQFMVSSIKVGITFDTEYNMPEMSESY